MKIDIGQWLEIFKTGDYGHKGMYTTSDLDLIIKNFNKNDQVPIIIGSKPKTSDPAWGWISELKRKGNVLVGQVGALHQNLRMALQGDSFRGVLVSIQKTTGGPKLLSYGLVADKEPLNREFLQPVFSFDSGRGSTFVFSFDQAGSISGSRFVDLAYKV